MTITGLHGFSVCPRQGGHDRDMLGGIDILAHWHSGTYIDIDMGCHGLGPQEVYPHVKSARQCLKRDDGLVTKGTHLPLHAGPDVTNHIGTN